MGLKCSVLGHAYGETTVERDREERGSEVVITIRELETCDRCGDTRIVTENKEVTTIETPDDSPDVTAADAMEAMGEDASGTDPSAGTEAATSVADTGDDAATDDGTIVEDAEGGAAVTDESMGSPSPDAVEDQGAEILDDEDDTDDAVDDELADPTIENDADVPGESSEDEDAVILDDEPASADDGETNETADAEATGTDEHTIDAEESSPFAAPADDETTDDPLGEWPEETLRDTEDDWTPSEDLTGTVGDVDPDANVDRELSTSSAVTVPEGEFHCEGCGYTTPVESSSLRAGDYCPECHTETLVHRAEK